MADYDPKLERATRDIVSRAIYAEMRAGRTTKHGGVYIKMSHLGPEKVAKQFKGMVERCADCGFDLAGGLVEVVPTAHYFMGGVVCGVDTSTELPGLFVAGEDASGMHGANRLGGNGVANSTVFGGIAGETMAGMGRGQRRASRSPTRTRSGRRWRARSIRSRARAATSTRLRETPARRHVGRRGRDPRCGGLEARPGQARRDRGRAAGGRRAGRRPRLQPDLARLAEPAVAGGDLQGDRHGRAQAREQPRRALSARISPAKAISPPRPILWRASATARSTSRRSRVQFTIVRPGQSLLKEAAE